MGLLQRMTVVGMVLAAGLLAGMPVAQGRRVQDVTRLKSDQAVELQGVGIVLGLKGTGDGGDFLPVIRPLAQMLGRLGDPVLLDKELKNANNVALVMVSVSVPAGGAHAGDKLDVKVSAVAAKSLKGGRLFICPLRGPSRDDPREYAFASGDIAIEDDTVPTRGVIRAGATGGAVMAADFRYAIEEAGKFTLVLQPSTAGMANATAIADQINEEVKAQTDGQTAAVAEDANTVVVTIPKAEVAHPAAFIARVQQLPVPKLPEQAKVIINSKSKTIVFVGDVELSPTIISHGGLTITVAATDAPANPPGSQVNFVALDPEKRGGPKLKELVEAFNLLKVGADDRISIIKQLHESGALHCQLQVD